MSQSNNTPNHNFFQLTLDLPAHLLPGYPRRGLLRVCVLCSIHGWRNLGALASYQLEKALWEVGR